jgi:Ca-activated chloride channel family protein
MFGHPEWGKLKYGYGFVGKSNSATFTEVLICMSGLKKLSGLTVDDVGADTPCGEAMAALEEAEIRIFQKSESALVAMRVSDSATRMSENGPAFLDAVTTYEQEVIELNLNYGPILPEPIVAVYPQDGTIVPSHPFAILDGGPSVTPEQANAAAVFLRFLLSDQQQTNLQNDGLRPANPDKVLEDPINHSNGADPQAITVMVEVPDAQVIIAIVELWECLRRGDCPR